MFAPGKSRIPGSGNRIAPGKTGFPRAESRFAPEQTRLPRAESGFSPEHTCLPDEFKGIAPEHTTLRKVFKPAARLVLGQKHAASLFALRIPTNASGFAAPARAERRAPVRMSWRDCTNNCARARIDRNRFAGCGYPSPASPKSDRWASRRCASRRGLHPIALRAKRVWVQAPLVETQFAGHSYGFRPGRGTKDALPKAGHVHVVDADLKSYFDTIPHERLMTLLKERVADGRVLALVESFLRAGVMEETRGWQATERGTPQGGVISPLLANIYLDPLDHQMAGQGYELVRYADDFVILCRSRAQAEEALAAVREWVNEAGLQLHPEKTRVTDASQKGGGFDFLGYHFERGHRWPRAKSLKKFKDTLRRHTQRNQGRSWQEIVAGVNRSLRGWHEYYQHSVANVFALLDGFVRRPSLDVRNKSDAARIMFELRPVQSHLVG